MINNKEIKMYELVYQCFKSGLKPEQIEKIDNATEELKQVIEMHKVYGLVSLAQFFLETVANPDLFGNYIDIKDESAIEIIDKLQGLIS